MFILFLLFIEQINLVRSRFEPLFLSNRRGKTIGEYKVYKHTFRDGNGGCIIIIVMLKAVGERATDSWNADGCLM